MPAPTHSIDDRHAPIELAPDDFRRLGHRMVDHVADFLATLSSLPVAPDTTPSALQSLLPSGPLPSKGSDPAALVDEAARLMMQHSTLNGHPRFLGYITSSAAPIGALADLLAAAINPNCGAWPLSPMAAEIERQTIRWIAELIGFPADCEGLLVSGGNMANIVCAIAASRARAGWDIRAEGLEGHPLLTFYASSEAHTWVQKAADICGLGAQGLRWVPADESSLTMRTDELERMIAEDRSAGRQPFMVVATAGSVSTGAIDPIGDIATICAREGLWLHVDGAYGAPAAVLRDAPDDLRALSRADSVAIDPHKWLYAPLEAGCVLVREPGALSRAFTFHPPYYTFEGEAEDPSINYHEYGPQNSRGFRALKVWMALRQVGREGYERMIADDVALARELHRLVSDHDELEALTQGLSITTFRYVHPSLTDAQLDALNTELLARMQRAGNVFLSNAVIGGRFAFRACVVNFRTTSQDVRTIVDETLRIGRELCRSEVITA